MDRDPCCNYHDNFLYKRVNIRHKKPIYYWVVIALDTITKTDLDTRADELKRKLPFVVHKSENWNRPIINECIVYNIETCNQFQPNILLEWLVYLSPQSLHFLRSVPFEFTD